ncbi:helix-turn-helix domain-containing protein [Yersinia sp. 1652 StPb PI]|uniref:AraC family transcriptional regulator n=1 Tax=Yersinia sp. 1652 StPb PI TaxID=3061649 RepID=UPI00355C7667
MQKRSYPSLVLTHWVAHYWCWKISFDKVYPEGVSASRILPDLFPGTGSELLFNLGEPLNFSTIPLATERAGNQLTVPKGGAVLLRPRKARLRIIATGAVDVVSIRLRSAASFPLLRVPLDELDDVPIFLTDLGLTFPISALVDILYEARIELVERWLTTLLNQRVITDPAIVWAVDRLYYGEELLDVRRQLELSERTLQRRFRQFTGVDARYFCRTAKFQRTLRQLLTTGNGLNNVLSHDYFDQSHFIKTCRLFTGSTPTALLTPQYRQLNHYISPELGQ